MTIRNKTDLPRRRLLAGAGALLLFPARNVLSALAPTPPQMAGPFYPDQLPLDDDNDLTRVRGRDTQAEGAITDLTGRLLDTQGRPVAQARIEIWQCDARGRYHHTQDSGGGPLDESFQGFGRTMTDSAGRYRFRTIRPVPYPGRTPHIHIAVYTGWEPPFTTQLYVRGEPRNAHDLLYARIPVEKRPLVLADFASGLARFDIVLGGTPNP